MRDNEKHTTRVSSDEARRLKNETDHVRLDAMTDNGIVKANEYRPFSGSKLVVRCGKK
jgi:hypothetical protein